MGRRKTKHPRAGKGKAQKALTPGRVRMYSRKGFTKTDMAIALKISRDSITDVFTANPDLKAAWEEGRTQLTMRLRNLQWRHAKTSVPMVLHMSRHQLGEHDQSLMVHKPDDGTVNLLHELFKLIDGTGRGLPDPSKVRLPIAYQPTIDVVATEPAAPTPNITSAGAENKRIAAQYGIDLDTLPPVPEAPQWTPEEIAAFQKDRPPIVTVADQRKLVMPPRMKSLLPDREEA